MVIEQLGAGAMGVVLRAYDPRLRREVALKLLHRHEDAEAEARMQREAQSMAQLNHPNVVGIYDAETTEHGVMIAMELVAGVPLDRWLKDESRSLSQVLDVFGQAGRGLAAAHAVGLIHRDFKPANVFVGIDADRQDVTRVRVGDFGLARETTPTRALETEPTSGEPSSVDLTATGTIMGTPVYMAPEQHLGVAADERSDQFAFCVSLWEALHGERPFEGTSVIALAYAKHHGKLRPPRAKIPAAIQAAISRGLSSAPADRWPDLATLLERLEPRRRRWGALALAGTIAVASVGITAAVTSDSISPREARCATAQEQLAANWNDEVRAELERTERGPARLFDALGSYAVQLDARYEQTCTATPPLDDLDFDVTMSCLEARTRRVWTVVELVSTSDVPRGKSIDKLIDSLTPIDRCAQTRWMGSRQLLPDDPQQRQLVLEIRDEIAAVRALESEGRVAEAVARADAATARAESSGFAPILGKALFVRSSLAKAERRFDYSAELLRQSLEIRLSIGDDEGGIAAATQLVFVRGVLQDHYEQADDWAAVARGLLERTDIGPIGRGWFHNHVGASMNARGEPEAALDFLRQSANELAEGLGPEHRSVADPLSHLANALVKLDRASEALEPARRALELRDAHYPPGSSALTAALVNRGRALSLTDSHEEALQHLRRAAEALESEGPAAKRAELWGHVARAHERAGQVEAAAEARERARALEPDSGAG